jgi:hypothetical protein
MELTNETAAQLVNEAISTLRDEPDEPKEGRGIVMSAGGVKYQINAWVCIRMLRRLGCELPIQCWFLGDTERNRAWEEVVAPYGVECVDAYEVRKRHPHARLHGWESKPYAIQHSPFAEVLFLDADNVPVRDPTFLFDTPEYRETGTTFWPDFGRLGPERLAWRVFGEIPYRDEPEVESGQIVVDKRRCWKALELCHWYMQNSNNFYFFHVHGDKEVFHLAWRKLEQPYAMPQRGIDALPGVMCQHDFEGNRIFQHRNMRKWTFYDNPQTKGFLYENECREYINELKHVWSPAADLPATPEDTSAISRLDGKMYEYHRVGYDHRTICLRRDGIFAEGAATCEYYWTIRDGVMIVADEKGSRTMELRPAKHGIWEGQWLDHEKMPVLLVP